MIVLVAEYDHIDALVDLMFMMLVAAAALYRIGVASRASLPLWFDLFCLLWRRRAQRDLSPSLMTLLAMTF